MLHRYRLRYANTGQSTSGIVGSLPVMGRPDLLEVIISAYSAADAIVQLDYQLRDLGWPGRDIATWMIRSIEPVEEHALA